MKEKLMKFMQGRYGIDTFSKCLLGIGLIVALLASFLGDRAISPLFYVMGWAIIVYCYVRMFSRNIKKRYEENQLFLGKTYKLRCFFQKQKELWKQKQVYRIYKCPSCGQKVRIPKGKGKIEVSCPKCSTTFIRKS